MKLDQARCSSIYRIRSRQSKLHLTKSEYMIAPFSVHRESAAQSSSSVPFHHVRRFRSPQTNRKKNDVVSSAGKKIER
jgi:hypothetical protein